MHIGARDTVSHGLVEGGEVVEGSDAERGVVTIAGRGIVGLKASGVSDGRVVLFFPLGSGAAVEVSSDSGEKEQGKDC